jgi:energy-coupling factor transport system permease protein
VWLYQERQTGLHSLHPVTKLLLLLIGFAGALAFSHPLWLLAPALALLLVTLCFRLLPAFRTVWVLMLILFLVTVILWTLFYGGGEPIASLGPLRLSRQGLLRGLGMGLRLEVMIATGIVYLVTTRIEEFTWALSKLGVPYRAAFTLGLSFRLVPLFLAQARRARDAQIARGLDLSSGGPLRRVRNHLPLFAPVLLSAIRRADRLAIALEVRGFGSRPTRTSLRRHSFAHRDWAALLLLGAAVTTAFVLRGLGFGGLAA